MLLIIRVSQRDLTCLGGSAGVLGSAFVAGVFRWTGSAPNGSSVDNIISNFPSFLPAPSVDNVKNRLGEK